MTTSTGRLKWYDYQKSLYVIEALLRQKKYFEFLRSVQADYFVFTFSAMETKSKSGYDTAVKLHQKCVQMLQSNFGECSELKKTVVSNIQLLGESDKTPSNDFLNKMQRIKGEVRKEEAEVGGKKDLIDNFLDLDLSTASVKSSSKVNGVDDLLLIDTPVLKTVSVAKPDVDLLDLGLDSTHSVKPPSTVPMASDFDFLI